MLVFEKMKEGGSITTKQVMSFFVTKERKSQRALRELGDAGLAASYREGSKVVWRPLPKERRTVTGRDGRQLDDFTYT